jgi:hypothetical protein
MDIENMPIADLVSHYRQAAEGTSNPDPEQANKSHEMMHFLFKRLRETEEGQAGIAGLLDDNSPHVRCWAAAHSLAWAKNRSIATLIALRDAKGHCSFDAEMTLREFEKGSLNFEY